MFCPTNIFLKSFVFKIPFKRNWPGRRRIDCGTELTAGAGVIDVYFRVPANGLRVNQYDFIALYSMWKIFWWVNVS